MKLNWKHTAGAVALSATLLSISAGAQVAPSGKPAKPPVEVTPPPPPSVDFETGQMKDCYPRRSGCNKGSPIVAKEAAPPPVDDATAPNADRGIKDQGVKGCNGCGLTGREAAPGTDGPGGGPHVDSPEAQGPGGGPRAAAAAKSKSGTMLAVLGGLAAIGAVLAVSGGNDNPASP